MGWRKHWRERSTELADEYRDKSTGSWLGSALLATVAGGAILGGALYLLDWAFQDQRHLLRSLSTGAFSLLGHECGGRFLGWRTHRKRTRQTSPS